MKFYKLFFIVIVPLAFFQFCATSYAGIATSNIPLNQSTQDIEYMGTDSIQKSWFHFDIGILGFPLTEPPVDSAIEELIKKYQGDALINIRYYTQRSIFLFITRNTLYIKADVVRIKKEGDKTKKEEKKK
ncbi:MAG: hypothetical protein ACK4UJ_05595 [Leptonema sp. (in: bacteria)]